MNLLMTFAQFERELASERTSDKMATTRRKGFWPGGTVPYGYKRIEKRLVAIGQGEVNDIDLDESGTLIRLFARAREWTRLLESGAFVDMKELAEGLKMDRPYVVRVLRLANLSPKILRAVLAKELPDDSSTERLFNIKSDLWSEQEREIGLA